MKKFNSLMFYKILISLIFCFLYMPLASAQYREEVTIWDPYAEPQIHPYYCANNICAMEYELFGGVLHVGEINRNRRTVNFIPTAEMRAAVAAIKDPTERMLNNTFWHMTTVAEVRNLIKAGAKLHAEQDNAMRLRILDFAMFSGKKELVWAVLDAAPNTAYISGGLFDGYHVPPITPLMRAVVYFPNDLAMAKRIVALGCDPKTVADYWTALTYAEYAYASSKVRQYLLSHMSPTLRLLSATFWETATEADVRREIKNGADVNYMLEEDMGYISPLWYALQYSKDYAVIQLLIDAGAKISKPDDSDYIASFKQSNTLTWAFDRSKDGQPFAVVIDKTGLNIRAEPNAKSAIVGEPLPEGAMLTITGVAQGNWIPISYEGRSGFVYKPLVITY